MLRINANINALRVHNAMVSNNYLAQESLSKLSTGLRINKAADDASGLQIADSLYSQAGALHQSIKNVNDTIGFLQIADKAMDEQLKILNTIKIKATQAAQDGQTTETRKALQEDIIRLMEELDNISISTSYNSKKLLAGTFIDKKFEIGAYSFQNINVTIHSTLSSKIGNTRFETSALILSAQAVDLVFKYVDGIHDISLESVIISNSAGTGVGVLAEVINKNSNRLGGIRAYWNVLSTGAYAVASGDIKGLKINGVLIGDILDIKANDKDAKLVTAINNVKDQTGVEAYIDNRGHINLRSIDGRGILVSAESGLSEVAGLFSSMTHNYGRISLVKHDGRDILISGNAGFLMATSATNFFPAPSNGIGGGFSWTSIGTISFWFGGGGGSGSSGGGGSSTNTTTTSYIGNVLKNVSQVTLNLRSIRGIFNSLESDAIGAYANQNVENYGITIGSGVGTRIGAMAVMDIVDTAIKDLNNIRVQIGAAQRELFSIIDNISITHSNVKAAESQIRDVDFAKEIAKFHKYSVLSQSGSFVLSQLNTTQSNVLKILQ